VFGVERPVRVPIGFPAPFEWIADEPGQNPERRHDQMGAREQAAIAELFAALNWALVELEMFSGGLLILNNRRVVHGRSEFRAQYDGTTAGSSG
jgi:Taurine catabolism dioxygenase TauD, TfdA family